MLLFYPVMGFGALPSIYVNIVQFSLLHVQILKDLKNAFWPFQLDPARSPFLRAAEAAHCFTDAKNANER